MARGAKCGGRHALLMIKRRNVICEADGMKVLPAMRWLLVVGIVGILHCGGIHAQISASSKTHFSKGPTLVAPAFLRGNGIDALELSRDGTTLIATSTEESYLAYDMATRRAVFRIDRANNLKYGRSFFHFAYGSAREFVSNINDASRLELLSKDLQARVGFECPGGEWRRAIPVSEITILAFCGSTLFRADLTSGKLHHIYTSRAWEEVLVDAAVFLPNVGQIAVAIVLFNPNTKERSLRIEFFGLATGAINRTIRLEYYPDQYPVLTSDAAGRFLVANQGKVITIWNLDHQKEKSTARFEASSGSSDGVVAMGQPTVINGSELRIIVVRDNRLESLVCLRDGNSSCVIDEKFPFDKRMGEHSTRCPAIAFSEMSSELLLGCQLKSRIFSFSPQLSWRSSFGGLSSEYPDAMGIFGGDLYISTHAASGDSSYLRLPLVSRGSEDLTVTSPKSATEEDFISRAGDKMLSTIMGIAPSGRFAVQRMHRGKSRVLRATDRVAVLEFVGEDFAFGRGGDDLVYWHYDDRDRTERLCAVDLAAVGAIEPKCHKPEERIISVLRQLAVSRKYIAYATVDGVVVRGLPNFDLVRTISSGEIGSDPTDGMHFSLNSEKLLFQSWRPLEIAIAKNDTSQTSRKYTDPQRDYASLRTAVYSIDDQFIFARDGGGHVYVYRVGASEPVGRLTSGRGTNMGRLSVIESTDGFGGILLDSDSSGLTVVWRPSECLSVEPKVKGECDPIGLIQVVDTNRFVFMSGSGDGSYFAWPLDGLQELSWIVGGEWDKPLPVEIFMRDYFEPNLLPRLLAGEKLSNKTALDKLNRVQPQVRIVSAAPEHEMRGAGDAETDTVLVTVEVAGDSREFGLGDASRRMTTGVYDLRLFRDGQLVGQWPPEPVTSGARQVDREQELARWRIDHRVVQFTEGASASERITFKGVRLPRIAGKDKVEFSAYAFNVDRVKSETSRLSLDLPKGLSPRVPRAYIVTVGVNAFEDESWDLKYAANDARQSGSELKRRLQMMRAPDGSRQYEKVVWVPLVSDADKRPGKARQITTAKADKTQIEAVLKTLAGQAVDPGALADIDSASDLRRVNPEDLLIIVISTHGLNEDGNFYFLPADIGPDFSPEHAPNPAAKAAMLARAVSNDELAQWLRGVDAVDQVMIIDACRSAASVQSGEFKPGPMGSRGLGQLAYDKGMRILAATQVEQDAIDGTDATKMGLLVYALIAEGLREGKADNAPADGRIMLSEWLNYANRRVPGVFQDIQDGTIKGTRGKVEHSPDPWIDAARRASLQQPSLFDFARGRDLPLVAP